MPTGRTTRQPPPDVDIDAGFVAEQDQGAERRLLTARAAVCRQWAIDARHCCLRGIQS
ncbi:hypothetical protein AB0D86_33205 [Streptomyces sp. NPDC048324]|uniref:hypothetical protein n=1 Tax=Streptomyces sp. NPDC048324 TaxID=3157205 RepID=UPI00343D6326